MGEALGVPGHMETEEGEERGDIWKQRRFQMRRFRPAADEHNRQRMKQVNPGGNRPQTLFRLYPYP